MKIAVRPVEKLKRYYYILNYIENHNIPRLELHAYIYMHPSMHAYMHVCYMDIYIHTFIRLQTHANKHTNTVL